MDLFFVVIVVFIPALNGIVDTAVTKLTTWVSSHISSVYRKFPALHRLSHEYHYRFRVRDSESASHSIIHRTEELSAWNSSTGRSRDTIGDVVGVESQSPGRN